jgi:hypothetical protein
MDHLHLAKVMQVEEVVAIKAQVLVVEALEVAEINRIFSSVLLTNNSILI